jgi:sugar phosphate isomerase/epimerase
MESFNPISRRSFIVQSSVLLSAMGMIPGTITAAKSKFKMGLQLFTIRKPMAEDAVGTLKQVAALGYQDTEIYGFNPAEMKYYGMKATEYKNLMDDLNLTATSGHYDFASYFNKSQDELLKYVDQVIAGAKVLDHKYITWPWLSPETRTIEHFKQLTGKLNAIGERVNKAGLGFAYHNHDFEFIDHNGEIGYDIVLKETDPKLVKLQVDLYWVMHSSKRTPAELFALAPGRFVMWHVKDMDKKTRDYSELGNGSIDYTEILPYASESGMQYYYIEQGGNFQASPMQSISDSAKFFKANLESYLK